MIPFRARTAPPSARSLPDLPCDLPKGDRTRGHRGGRVERAAPAPGLPPLLAQLLAKQAATGLPPAYLPKDEGDDP